ncbi:MAG TPA: endonuclease/exonuclease/phosphatase family protein [Chthoniobacteraceae bacterium]|jgi:endonuclease/exonuclease/phosphatase family metal-dependent hydrolase|nr:endonuclease/exonuclease/phosphatase family protein [Chthoniobacteraceae bacterium]
MTYNVHSCVGTDALLSPQRIADVIGAADPDVVCLQEIDLGRARTRRVDQAAVLAECLDMQMFFHPAIRLPDEQYGDAILSKHRLQIVRAGTLPTVASMLPLEPRGAIWVSILCEGVTWQVLNTHFGLCRSERRVQARALASDHWIGGAVREGHVAVCGDFNSRPRSIVHRLLTQQVRDAQLAVGDRHARTFSTQLPFVCLDYIFVSSDVEVRSVRPVRTSAARLASDHFPLVAELVPLPSEKRQTEARSQLVSAEKQRAGEAAGVVG